MEKSKNIRKRIIINYLKKHHEKYSLDDLKSKILGRGYSKEELDDAVKTLKLKDKKSIFKEIVSGKKHPLTEEEGEREKPDPDEIKRISKTIKDMKNEIGKVVIGQEKIIDSLIRAILCDGHVLLEGVPGIAKTLAIKSLAKVTGCESKRIQFTVDLLPTDILGLTTYTPKKGFEIIKGPIFANFVIADEINRSPPKTQSALIEAMQEKQVTIGKETFRLSLPFFVMATENPLETGGVYTLPEAQIDRFLFKIIMGYPDIKDEDIIMSKNTTLRKFDEFELKSITNPQEIVKMQELTKKIYLSKKIRKYILRIIELTRTKETERGKYIEWGASPRATIALFIASKAKALMEGRNFVVPGDVKESSYEVLRHRIILSYKARVEHINSDDIIKEILKKVKVP
jgi:MoxR-like ATPase